MTDARAGVVMHRYAADAEPRAWHQCFLSETGACLTGADEHQTFYPQSALDAAEEKIRNLNGALDVLAGAEERLDAAVREERERILIILAERVGRDMFDFLAAAIREGANG